MKSGRRHSPPRLPLAPLLHAYRAGGLFALSECHSIPGLGARFAAIRDASKQFLSADFLDGAREDALRDALVGFYDAVVTPALHTEQVRLRTPFLRHALAHLLRGPGPLAARLDQLLAPTGAYHVPGLGPSFWSAVAQGLAPTRLPGWTLHILNGARRLGLVSGTSSDSPARIHAALQQAHDRLRGLFPDQTLTSLHLDHFFTLIAHMRGRNPLEGVEASSRCLFADAVQEMRAREPLRQRLKDRGQDLAAAQEKLEAGLAIQNGTLIGAALATADPVGAARSRLDWHAQGELLTLWVGRLWEADDPTPILTALWAADDLPGAGLWLPAAVLHLRDPQSYLPFNEETRRGWELLDDSAVGSPAIRHALFTEAAARLRQRHGLHPLETPAVLAALASPAPAEEKFVGFCADTFHFLGELEANNQREWMDRQRSRYGFAVRTPLAELCAALTSRYIEPVLRGRHGWTLDTTARPGRALTSVCKNAFGRTAPYNPTLWIIFSATSPDAGDDARQSAAQLFVRLDRDGLSAGLRLGRPARAALERLRQNLHGHGEAVTQLLRTAGVFNTCQFGPADAPGESLTSEVDLLAWANGRSAEASRRLAADDPRLAGEDLVGEVMLAFDQLLPLFACCLEADAGPALARLGGVAAESLAPHDFCSATHLPHTWLGQALELLAIKKQLILHGVPGTGKTFVARRLADYLTGGDPDAVRLIQFHPAYGYEEFVEGIKVRSVRVEDRYDVTYPVEDGLLTAFASQAATRPARPHVLIIDEINRGNLPRIFGELLFLLEYRGQSAVLPCSRRSFRLPDNLILLATMNGVDRSIAPLDQALRRRFSFLEMEPDPAVLASWFEAHPPVGGATFAGRIVRLFEALDARLRSDLGAQARIGHSYFMVPDLDEARLGLIYRHHLRPLLQDHLIAQGQASSAADRLAPYDALWAGGSNRARREARRELPPQQA